MADCSNAKVGWPKYCQKAGPFTPGRPYVYPKMGQLPPGKYHPKAEHWDGMLKCENKRSSGKCGSDSFSASLQQGVHFSSQRFWYPPCHCVCCPMFSTLHHPLKILLNILGLCPRCSNTWANFCPSLLALLRQNLVETYHGFRLGG